MVDMRWLSGKDVDPLTTSYTRSSRNTSSWKETIWKVGLGASFLTQETKVGASFDAASPVFFQQTPSRECSNAEWMKWARHQCTRIMPKTSYKRAAKRREDWSRRSASSQVLLRKGTFVFTPRRCLSLTVYGRAGKQKRRGKNIDLAS